MIKTFKEWYREMAGTGAIYDGTDSPDFNWWGAVGVDKGDYSKKPLETDVNHPKKKHKKHKHKKKEDE